MNLKQEIAIIGGLLIVGTIFASHSAVAFDSAPPTPTVAECVKKTGFTEEKCTEMIANIKDKKPGEGMKRGGPGGSNGSGRENMAPTDDVARKSGSIIERELEMAEKMKTREEKRFSNMETRIEKIIDFLKSKDIETTTIESDLETFKSKTAAILSSFETYINVLEDLKSNSATELSDSAKTGKENTKSLLSDLKNFYKNTLRENIKTQIDKLTD